MSFPSNHESSVPAASNKDIETKSTTRAKRLREIVDIDALKKKVYTLDDLSAYRFRDRLSIRVIGVTFYLTTGLICSTLRWEVRGREHLERINADGRRTIFAFWHVCIITATWFWRKRGIVVMSSASRDAEYTGRVIKRFGYGTSRGSATRGGGRALAEMATCLEMGMDVAFTIDGPRGPVYIAKPGAVTLARHTGHAILPFHIVTKKQIEIPSWDRLQIPVPFTRAITLIGEPIYVPREATAEEVAEKQQALQSSLDELRRQGEEWQKG
jgi:lysophospholipid acyltransferase (LPLAT)-like uncharacterized protein